MSPKEIKKIIKALQVKKAPGHDNINNNILKNLPDPVIAYITNIYNSCFQTGYFPQTWKHAIIFPVLKSNKKASLVESCGRISLPPVSKICLFKCSLFSSALGVGLVR